MWIRALLDGNDDLVVQLSKDRVFRIFWIRRSRNTKDEIYYTCPIVIGTDFCPVFSLLGIGPPL